MTFALRGASSSTTSGPVISLRLSLLDLLPDARHQIGMVGVLVVRRVEALGHVVDQALRERDLLRADTGGLQARRRQIQTRRGPQLVPIAQRDEHQRSAVRHHRGQVLLRADHDLGHRNAGRRAQRLPQQRVDLLAAARRRQVVRRFEVAERDLVGADERAYVDGLRRFDVGQAKVVVGEDDIPILLVFVALDDVRPVDVLAGGLAVALVADRRQVALVEHGELERLAVFGRVELHRNVHEAEADGSGPERARHVATPPRRHGGIRCRGRRDDARHRRTRTASTAPGSPRRRPRTSR